VVENWFPELVMNVIVDLSEVESVTPISNTNGAAPELIVYDKAGVVWGEGGEVGGSTRPALTPVIQMPTRVTDTEPVF
jgi:hypothetical protein